MPYYNEQDRVLTVTTLGSVETKFTHATFKASVTTHAQTGPDAKKSAKKAIDAITEAIARHAKEGRIDTDRLRTSFSVDTSHNRNSGEFNGYKATYSINFDAKNVSYATTIHDALTSIVNVESPTPVFNIENTPELSTNVFADACAKADAKFKAQCACLNINPNDFFLATWSTQEDRPSGKFMAFSPQLSTDFLELPGDGPDLEPGKASASMRVTFNYVRRPVP